MKFTKLPPDTFQKLVLNAGILVDYFTPATGVIGNLMGATTGGITFNSNPTYQDFGEDVDNCPNGTMELKRIDQFDPAMSGTFLTLTAAVVKDLIGAADIAVGDNTHIVPRDHLIEDDFKEVWWIGDYSDVPALVAEWRSGVLAEAKLAEDDLSDDERKWLGDEVARAVESVRLDARGVQRALAARLQRQWIDNPSALGGISDPGELADALRSKSLKLVSEATGAEVLP